MKFKPLPKKEWSMTLIQENIRTLKYSLAQISLNELVDQRVNAQNNSNRSQQFKSLTTQLLTRVVFCFIRWCFVMYFSNGLTTKNVHRQYILLTIGSHSSNEIVNRMNRLINAIMNAEKDCHRVLDSLNLAMSVNQNSKTNVSTTALTIQNYKYKIGQHICQVENIHLDKGVTHLSGTNGSGKTVF